MYVKIENGIPAKWPVYEHEIRATRSGDSLPEYLSDEFVSELGYAPFVVNGYPPEYDATFQNIEEIIPVLKDGKYHQSYKISEKYSEEEKQQFIEQKNKIANGEYAKSLLTQSDWVEYPSTSDTTRTPHLVNLNEWIDYRVALRAIVVNPPSIVEVWPVMPLKQWSN